MILRYRDPEFWPRFRETHWNPRRPTVLKNPFVEFPFSETVLLRAMQNFQKGLAAGDERLRCMVDIDGKQAPHRKALRTFLGGPADTFEEMEARNPKGRSLGLMVNDLQAIDPAIWHSVCAFLRDAHPHVDFPVARTVLDLFYGNYAASFLGLHKDTQEIFAFVVRGEKTLLAWPFDYFTSRVPGLDVGARLFQTRLPVDYRKYRKDALVLKANAGDVIYWPSDYWHIAEGVPGDFSGMLSLGLFLPQMVSEQGARELARFRERVFDPAQDTLRSTDVSGLADDDRLRWATGFGFKLGGPTEKFPKKPAAAYRKNATAWLLWNRQGRLLQVSANGYSIALPDAAPLRAFLAKVASEERVALPPKKSAAAGTVLQTDWSAKGALRTRKVKLSGDRTHWLARWLQSVGAIEAVA